MNVLGIYRANGQGHLSPTRQQREEAYGQVTANLRARLFGLQGGVAKLAAMQAKSAGSAKVAETQAAAPANDINRDMFLRLLMEQIRNQDPLEPMGNEQMLAQLAQFSSLEQMNNLNASFEGLHEMVQFLNGNIDQLNFLTAQGMIGRYVEGIDAAGAPVRGEVQSITLAGSIVILSVDGEPLPMTGVMLVSADPPANSNSAPESEEGQT
jgi:flagellar basal-body rod modification protein FlgD